MIKHFELTHPESFLNRANPDEMLFVLLGYPPDQCPLADYGLDDLIRLLVAILIIVVLVFGIVWVVKQMRG